MLMATSARALELSADEPWDAQSLRKVLRTELHGQQVIVVSNRAPYVHEHHAAGVRVVRPAGGLVTALDPLMRACAGTWIAHGSGSADAAFVDDNDICPVPPGAPEYALRRVWLGQREQQGFCDGFANQGLWPLCHLAHVRPVFSQSDWQHYQRVNERFADVVLAEARSHDPIVLVQDYHFALLPALIRARLPRATIISFWHIPWPHPDQLAICPWQRELVQGLLGGSIVGLQTELDRTNFSAAVDRLGLGDAPARARCYPISIGWPGAEQQLALAPVAQSRRDVRERYHLPSRTRLLLGVDRFDYTKGLLERLQALEHLLLTQPQWVGKLSLLQVAAPTRSGVPAYALFRQQVEAEVARINQRFGAGAVLPIQWLAEQQDRAALDELYRAADACIVSSLHDGMNLVCKEFVAARDDEQGVLVLSRFAGAAAELTDALPINPYHVEQSAGAMLRAVTMAPAEQRERMRRLRTTVRAANIYRWAGSMLLDAAALRAERPAALHPLHPPHSLHAVPA